MSSSATDTLPTPFVEKKPYNPEHLRPRRVRFTFSEKLPRLWLRGSALQTHFWNGLNLFVPSFERYMVKLMHGQLSQVKDAHMREQIRGFMGQEATHSRMHEGYIEMLKKQGYRLDGYLKVADLFFGKVLPRAISERLGLALLAGFEHLTALLSEMLLAEKMMEGGVRELKELWEWHAAEELEHKSMAFDFFKAVGGTGRERAVGAFLGMAVVLGFTLTGMVMLLAQEGVLFQRGWLREAREYFFGSTRRLPRAVAAFRAYFQRDFHPSQHNTEAYARAVLTA